MSPPDTAQRELLRLQLLANGYTPLANVDKRCMLKGWPSLHVDAKAVKHWSRLHGLNGTGIRVQDGLCPLDFDIPDRELMDATADAVFEALPHLADPAVPLLVRHGKSFKEAWFTQCDAMFGCIRSYKYIEPGMTAETGRIACFETFNGGSARQFGAFGPHTRPQDADDGVGIDYRWHDLSPLDVKLADLPKLSKADCFTIVKVFQETARALGWQQVMQSASGENAETRVYNLTDDMVFDCNDGVTRTLDELRRAVSASGEMRCSASWLEGPTAKRRDRCLVGKTRSGHVYVVETALGVTHVENAASEPFDAGALARALVERYPPRRGRRNNV